MLHLRRKSSIKLIAAKTLAALLTAALAFCLSGSYVCALMWDAIGKTVQNVSLPVAVSLSDAEAQGEEGIVSQIISEVIPLGTVYRLSYVNAVGCETNYSVEVSGSVVQNVTTGTGTNTGTNTVANTVTTGTAALDPSVISRDTITGTTYTRQQLDSYAFTKRFYTVASATSLTESILKPKEFLDKDMSVSHDAQTPQILIFHTHSQEGFSDSVEGDDTTTILGAGDYLTELLSQKYGYNVIHDRSIYDYVDGKLDRSKAYTYAEKGIEAILAEYPSIEVVIDLHRDGVSEGTRLVTQVDGVQMAKVMFFNGISYSNAVGNISYLSNAFRDDNLAMSLQMQLLGEAYYPGFLRNIYINSYRYCLHERAKSMLIEAGAQTNTFEEVKNAMEPLADLLDKLLSGERAY